MIVAYHRPTTLQEALDLLARSEPVTVPLGGGTILSRPGAGKFAVVDLQALGLNQIERQGDRLMIGATATLQSLYAHAAIPAGLRAAIERETTYNLRQTASVGGAIVTADGRSPFAAALLALSAVLKWADGTSTSLEEYFAARKSAVRGLILRVAIPAASRIAFETISKTPADFPILMGAAGWGENGLERLVLGGAGDAPVAVAWSTNREGEQMTAELIEKYMQNAYSQYSNQVFENLDYIKTTSALLLRRLSSG